MPREDVPSTPLAKIILDLAIVSCACQHSCCILHLVFVDHTEGPTVKLICQLGANWEPSFVRLKPFHGSAVARESRDAHQATACKKMFTSSGRGPFDVQRAATAMEVAARGPTFLWQVGNPSCHKCMARIIATGLLQNVSKRVGAENQPRSKNPDLFFGIVGHKYGA